MAHEVLLTRKEAARALGISVVTLWRLAVRGDLPTVRIGGRVLFRERDVVAFVDARVSRKGHR